MPTVGHDNPCGKIPKEPSIVSVTSASSERRKIHVVHDPKIALGVAIEYDNIALLKKIVRMNKVHNGQPFITSYMWANFYFGIRCSIFP
jgi:hypothetical protein